MFPDTIGAFVAEMDFGLAPAISDAMKAAIDRAATGYLPTQLADGLDAVARLAAEKDGRVFSDEIHAPIVYAPAAHIPSASISDAAAVHPVTATSASKAWNRAGLKCAQIILSNDADAAAWKEFGSWAGHGTANLGVVANTAAYSGGAPWLDDVIEYRCASLSGQMKSSGTSIRRPPS